MIQQTSACSPTYIFSRSESLRERIMNHRRSLAMIQHAFPFDARHIASHSMSSLASLERLPVGLHPHPSPDDVVGLKGYLLRPCC
eukprot:scaffold20035_cov90-Attheya_sp.AAC.1